VIRKQRIWSCLALALASVAAAMGLGCGSSPSGPGQVPPPPPATNLSPTIESIAASASRTEVGADVTLTATVKDPETPISQMTFEWKADVGTISGTGSSVTWQVPKDAATPTDHTIRLTVTENYGNGQHNVVNGTSPVIRVHNSPKEMGDIVTGFLQRFGDSNISTTACLSDFSDALCSRGKNDEMSDIDYNRKHYVITSYHLELPRVTYTAGANSGEVFIRSSFTSRIVNCQGWPNNNCVLNATESVTFDEYAPMVYDQGRWWMCASNALAAKTVSPLMERFVRFVAPPPGLVVPR
jgi:hypothetical protein